MASRYDQNVLLQPRLIGEILGAPKPSWMSALKGKRICFVGIGTSFHAAQIAKILWRRHVHPQTEAAHSFDFARLPQPVGRGDVVVLLSHRGTKSFTVEAAKVAHGLGAVTVGVTSKGSPWRDHLTHRLESCESEDTGAFTKSMTSTLAWIARWMDSPELNEGLREVCGRIEDGPPFPRVQADTDLILLGDLEREWVAREIALKVQEAAYLRARAFGLEEFLHGPRVSAGSGSMVVAFSARTEPRWEAVRNYLAAVEVPLIEFEARQLPAAAAWLGQLFWGQRLASEICRQLGLDPDTLRTQDPRYKKARESLAL